MIGVSLLNFSTANEQTIISGILHAMSITEKDLADDFREAISKTNRNGLPSAVWARRSDDLVDQFKQFYNIEVFHISRSRLWQIEPIFNRVTGDLYLLFTDTNLARVKRKYLSKGFSTHYLPSFLLKNSDLLPIEENMELLLFDKEAVKKNDWKRQKDIEKMIGKDAKNVKKVITVSVSYHENEAIAALLKEYTSDFELSKETDVSYMLKTTYSGDNIMDDKDTPSYESVQSLVTLKRSENISNK